MIIEHIAWQVEDPESFSQWYSENLGMKLIRRGDPEAQALFLGDSGGKTLIEVYRNKRLAVPDYPAMDSLQIHLAFAVENIETEVSRLRSKGAGIESTPKLLASGDKITMLRDPWGFPIQLVQRAEPMISP